MSAHQFGPLNPMWRGGRSIASNGYVLIRVGKAHHLADCRGYAYEHRLVAEQKLGRRLLPGEIPHHIDGNKQNNDPVNLEVVAGNAEHFLRHRQAGCALHRPGDPNPLVLCACGCGATFRVYDSAGRPRRYISGHNPIAMRMTDAALDALESGPLSVAELAQRTGQGRGAARILASRLSQRGVIRRVGRGRYALPSPAVRS